MAYRTIMLAVNPERIREGSLTAVAVTPGFLLERTSTAGQFQAHSTAGGPGERIIAIEDYTQGKEITDAYAASSKVLYVHCAPGDRVAVRIRDDSSAAGGDINIGDALESDGAGKLRKWTAPTGAVDSASDLTSQFHILAYADEAVDMSDSSGVHGSGHIAAVVA